MEEVVGPGIPCICNPSIPGGKSLCKSTGGWGLAGERCLDADAGMERQVGVSVSLCPCVGVSRRSGLMEAEEAWEGW